MREVAGLSELNAVIDYMSPSMSNQSEDRLPVRLHISFSRHSRLIGTHTVLERMLL